MTHPPDEPDREGDDLAHWSPDPHERGRPSDEASNPAHDQPVPDQVSARSSDDKAGDDVGVPIGEPEDAEAVAEEDDLFAHEPVREATLDQEMGRLAGGIGRTLRALLFHPALLGLVVVAGALVGLVLLSQALQVIHQATMLPPVLGLLVLGVLALLASIVVGAMGLLIWTYVRLPTTPALALGSLDELADRADERGRIAQGQWREARDRLGRFVGEYPLGEEDAPRLRRLGLTDDEIRELREAASALQSRDRFPTTRGWVEHCDRRFLAVLDRAAKRRTRRYALFVAAKTAAVPSGLFSSLIVLLNVYLLISNLCAIYRLRTNMVGTCMVFAQVFLATYVAGQIGEWADSATDWVVEGGGALTSVTKYLGEKFGEGAVNGLFFGRIGYSTAAHLRPLRLG